VERRAKCVAYNLKDISIAGLNGLAQNLMVTREQGRHRIRILLCDFGAAFDVGEEESNGTTR
jgi:hypothetical protein